MTASPLKPLADKTELFSKETDPLRICFQGHALLNELLAKLLKASVPVESHTLEIEKMSLGLKADLCIALGTLNKESRSAVMKLNWIRNKFAHELNTYSFDNNQANDLLNCLGRWREYIIKNDYSEDPIEILKSAHRFICLQIWADIRNVLTQKEVNKVWQDEMATLAKELLEVNPELGKDSKNRPKALEGVEGRVLNLMKDIFS